MFLCLDLVLYIEGYLYILHVILFRLIVLYPWCRINRDTNMSVVCVLCHILIAFTVRAFGPPTVVFPTCGAHPH